jgi:hypothetical protein
MTNFSQENAARFVHKQTEISAETWHENAGAIRLREMPPVRERSPLKIFAIGEAAVAGAGLGVALIGAMELATAITAQQWLAEAKHYIDYSPLVGGVVGAISGGYRIARRRRWQTVKIAAVSDHTVAGVRTELEGTSQIAKLDKTIGADGKARSARKPSADVILLPVQGQPQEVAR